MEHKIIGTTMPVLEMTLEPGDRIVAESGELSWMTSTIDLQTSMSAGGNKGGIIGAAWRSMGGGTFFMTEFSAKGGSGMVAFATKVPGHILAVDVTPTSGYLIHRHGFLCGTSEIGLGVGFQKKFGAGFAGGNGFVLQKIEGQGQAWVELDGEVVSYDLKPGETLRVHPGHVGMLEASVDFGITRVPGIKNMFLGGDGLFLAALTGPGKVWLQSLPLANLAHALAQYLPGRGSENASSMTGAGIAGAVLGSLIGGNKNGD